MRFDKVILSERSGGVVQVGFDYVDGSRRLPMRKCVDEDRGFVSVLKREGEIEASYAKIGNAAFEM